MAPLLDAAKAWYRSEGWGFEVAENKPVLRLSFTGKSGTWPCYAQAVEEDAVFVFYSFCQENIPANRVTAVLEYLNRANMDLAIGNFEFDAEVRAVRFRTSVDLEGVERPGPLIKSISLANVVTTDRYLPGLKAVVGGSKP